MSVHDNTIAVHAVVLQCTFYWHIHAAPCRDNIVSCQNGVCTCQTGFGGPDCCQCRDFAVADTCTDTACQCQDGYATPDCCQCDDNYYRASDGTCQSMLTMYNKSLISI